MKGDPMVKKKAAGTEPTLKTLPKRKVTEPSKQLETFASPRPGRAFEIRFETEEFTCLCPMTGQPDFAHLTITYVPDQLCVESKSLKLYLWSFRNEGAFHEAVTNRILDDLRAATQPQWIRVEGDFLIRGGIRTVVVAEHGKRP
jgi:7-cyano-7-deazaguanine reductase